MFYPIDIPEPTEKVAALVTLNPSESRRLIAKATVALPEVKAAMKKGWIIIARGITAAYVSEELFNIEVNPKSQQTIGIISRGITNTNNAPPPCTMHVVHDGKVVENADSNVEILNFGPDDVFIKQIKRIAREVFDVSSGHRGSKPTAYCNDSSGWGCCDQRGKAVVRDTCSLEMHHRDWKMHQPGPIVIHLQNDAFCRTPAGYTSEN